MNAPFARTLAGVRMSAQPAGSPPCQAQGWVDPKEDRAQRLLLAASTAALRTLFISCKQTLACTYHFFKHNLSMFLFQLTYFHFHLFISGTVVFSVDFIGGLDTYSYRQPPQDHVELKPVKPVGKVPVLRTILILLTGLKANLLLK